MYSAAQAIIHSCKACVEHMPRCTEIASFSSAAKPEEEWCPDRSVVKPGFGHKIQADDMVFLTNLISNADLNGKTGTVQEISGDKAVVMMQHTERLVRVSIAKCRRMEIMPMECGLMPMEWGPDRSVVKPAFYDEWSRTISMNDPMFWANHSLHVGERDVYQYLQLKLRQVLNQVSRVGQAGWAFLQSDQTLIINCLVWADGTHCQK